VPEFFQMVQNATKQSLEAVVDKTSKEEELWYKLNLESNFDRKTYQ
jgi:hypothetical protein